jgi:hypothetical protein
MGVTLLDKNLLAETKTGTSVSLQDAKHTTAWPARRTVTFLQLLQKTPSNLRLQITIQDRNILQS